jgi:uncharacterized protein YutE (UPF0331/DUF86 family)
MRIDINKVLSQIKIIEEDLKKLKEKAKLSLSDYLSNEDAQDVVERRFQTAIESCINIGNHLISVLGLRAPEDYASVFYILAAGKVISKKLAEEMADLARFRNLLVHLYWKIDHQSIHRKMNKRISTLRKFISQIVVFVKP